MPRAVYVAGPDGFTAAGRLWHETVVVPALQEAALTVLDPWAAEVGRPLEEALALVAAGDAGGLAALEAANRQVAAANLALIDRADVVLAVLDGPDVDSGTAAEMGWAARSGKLVVGLRTDLRRSGDNAGTTVNLQVEYCVHLTGGVIAGDVGTAVAAAASLPLPSAGPAVGRAAPP